MITKQEASVEILSNLVQSDELFL